VRLDNLRASAKLLRAWVEQTKPAMRAAGGQNERRNVLPRPENVENSMMKKWSKPKFENLRYGFEINLYVKVR
jgi:coenzyme PQQ precursor peptide PqqA